MPASPHGAERGAEERTCDDVDREVNAEDAARHRDAERGDERERGERDPALLLVRLADGMPHEHDGDERREREASRRVAARKREVRRRVEDPRDARRARRGSGRLRCTIALRTNTTIDVTASTAASDAPKRRVRGDAKSGRTMSAPQPPPITVSTLISASHPPSENVAVQLAEDADVERDHVASRLVIAPRAAADVADVVDDVRDVEGSFDDGGE